MPAEERRHHLMNVVNDTTQAVELKVDYTKAYFRKAQAHIALENLKEALLAVDTGLKAVPGEETLVNQRKEIIDKMPVEDRPEEPQEEEEEDLLDVE